MPGFDLVSRSKGLAMSSSSDTQLSTTTTSSSYNKFKYTPTASYTNELQEVTSCTKETVRITPPPHDAVALRPTMFIVDNTPNGSPYQYRNARASSLPKMSADQRIADKQCQTDDVIVYSSPSKISHSVDTLSNDNVHSMSTLSVSLAASNHPNHTDESARNRELDHINVIVNECQSSADNISYDSVDIGKSKDKQQDNKVVYQVNLDKPYDKPDNDKYDKEEDTCCVKCFLTALQICDCCHIS